MGSTASHGEEYKRSHFDAKRDIPNSDERCGSCCSCPSSAVAEVVLDIVYYVSQCVVNFGCAG